MTPRPLMWKERPRWQTALLLPTLPWARYLASYAVPSLASMPLLLAQQASLVKRIGLLTSSISSPHLQPCPRRFPSRLKIRWEICVNAIIRTAQSSVTWTLSTAIPTTPSIRSIRQRACWIRWLPKRAMTPTRCAIMWPRACPSSMPRFPTSQLPPENFPPRSKAKRHWWARPMGS